MHRRTALRRCSPFPAGRLRASRALVFSQNGDALTGLNFLSKQEFSCDRDLLDFVAAAQEWEAADAMAARFGGLDADTLNALLGMGVLVEEGTDAAQREATYLAGWRWGMPAAAMHFCVDGIDIVPLEESERRQLAKAATSPSPPLWRTNDHLDRVVGLPAALPGSDLLRLMARRRTLRDAGGILSLSELSDCLFAGMGITGETENCVGTLPLSMTPSGGARNPFEAYVFARAVAGLEPGVYHYSAIDHTLGRLEGKPCPDLAALVGNQEWVSKMPALVMLAAMMERPMWKYEDANAYRVMLIEAGHIGQNVALAATAHGLTACPTAAIAHQAVRDHLDLCPVLHAPVYALAIGRP